METARAISNLLYRIAALAAVIACSAGPALADAAGVTKQLVDAAKKEGQVTYYTSADLALANKLKAAFEKKYGVTVNVLRQSSAPTFNRAVQEFDLGVNAADVIETSVVSAFLDMKAKGMLMSFAPATANLIRSPKLSDPDHYWHAVKLELTSLNYNKDLLKPADVPKTWKDLLDPKYKGKVVQGHIKASGDTGLIVFNLVKMYGWEYFEGLRKNDVLTMQACTQNELVARGERLIMMCDYSQIETARIQHLPMIAGVLPKDGVFMLVGPVAVLAKAPHPNAARLLVDFLLSPEGQTIYVEGGDAASIDSPDVKLPPDFPDLKQYKLVDTDVTEYRKWLPEGTAKFIELFGG
jgi:iron(III) transport system substrate-binding protein